MQVIKVLIGFSFLCPVFVPSDWDTESRGIRLRNIGLLKKNGLLQVRLSFSFFEDRPVGTRNSWKVVGKKRTFSLYWLHSLETVEPQP